MADIVTMDLTTAGLKLYGKMQIGLTALNVSRIVIGIGYLNGNETALDLDALKNEIDVTTLILSNEIVGNGQTKLSFRITSGSEDFYLREIGVMAIDPDEGEILYCYCNYGDWADYVMVYGGMLPVTQEADIYFAIGAGSIKVEFAKETAAVSYKDFEEHTSNKKNPHGVTAAQVFPNNASVLEGITEDSITNFNAAAKARHTHENKSVLDKITDVLVEKWNNAVSHITNKANPHGVTKSQVGLGNVTNESKKTMFNSPEFTGIPKAPTASAGTSTTQIATTAFIHNLLNKDYGNIYMTDKLDVVSASGTTDVTQNMGEKVSQLLNTVETTWGKAVHGKDYGTAYYSSTENVDLYIKLYFSDDVLYWDEYYYNPGGDAIYIGSECTFGHRGDELISFSYENSEAGGADLVSLRDAVIYLLRKAGVGGR